MRSIAGSQILLQRAPFAQPLVHVGLEEAERAAALGLGAIKRGVGIADQRRGVGAVDREDRDADAEAGAHRVAVDGDVVVDRREQPIGQGLGRGRLFAVGGDHDEFVAAEPGQESAADGGLQARRQLAQQLVAGGMAVNVVDLLEPVEVEAHQRERLAVAGRGLDGGVDAGGERGAVRQAGEQVVMHQPRDLGLGALAMGAILDHGEQILRLAVRIADRHARRGGDADVAAWGRQRMLVVELRLAGCAAVPGRARR